MKENQNLSSIRVTKFRLFSRNWIWIW